MSLLTTTRRLTSLTLLALSTACTAATVEVQNNHPFPIHMPWTVKDADGKSTPILLDVPANGHQTIDTAATPKTTTRLAILTTDTGAKLNFDGKDLGTLTWSLVLHPVPAADAKNDALSAGRPANFQPQPLALSFKRSADNYLFTTYTATTSSAGLDITVDLDAYPTGFLDIRTTVTNRSAPTKNVYAAVLTNWSQPANTTRTIDYDTTVSDLKDSTPWRKPGDRHFFVLRGLNWLNSSLPVTDSREPTAPRCGLLWLNEFAPSFTVHHDAKGKTPAQWLGANSAQLDQEAYLDGNTLVHVTELAHGNVKSYRGRLDDYVLPDASQPLSFTHRLAFTDKPVDATAAANAFVAYTSYNPLKLATGNSQLTTTLNLGTPGVTFGTAYFPYSTLGENFIQRQLPGMSQDSYWPLAADVVKNYKFFADQIRTDLRIAKSMGFQSIRLHHLEMIFNNPVGGSSGSSGEHAEKISDKDRDAFLDFLFAELKHCGLTALLDVKIKPDQLADLLKRYRDTIDGVEIDNEILIFGIKDEDVPYWKQCYDAVKAVAPDVPVQWTAHTNTGAFNRMTALQVPFDRLGQHAYMDSVEACPMSRDFALQVSDYATKVNKPASITEWNWRFLTRLTEEARAKVYAPIFENVLKSRAMTQVYQFQLNDCLAMSPLALKGIRHYELLNLSRRPKAEAAEFQKLIDTYAAPDSSTRMVKADRQVATVRDGKATATFTITNSSNKPLTLVASTENLRLQIDQPDINPQPLAPGASSTLNVTLSLPPDAQPGFYHDFVRLEDKANHVLRYLWLEARNPGQPTFDTSTHPDVASSPDAFTLDLTKPTAIVYGDNCPIPELEAAWVVYQTLESATGQRVFIFTAKELPTDGSITNVIYVGTSKSLPSSIPPSEIRNPKSAITRLPNSTSLVLTGSTSQDAALAAMDYTLRYWKTAKDAACRRVPLVEREIPKGGDASQLP